MMIASRANRIDERDAPRRWLRESRCARASELTSRAWTRVSRRKRAWVSPFTDETRSSVSSRALFGGALCEHARTDDRQFFRASLSSTCEEKTRAPSRAPDSLSSRRRGRKATSTSRRGWTSPMMTSCLCRARGGDGVASRRRIEPTCSLVRSCDLRRTEMSQSEICMRMTDVGLRQSELRVRWSRDACPDRCTVKCAQRADERGAGALWPMNRDVARLHGEREVAHGTVASVGNAERRIYAFAEKKKKQRGYVQAANARERRGCRLRRMSRDVLKIFAGAVRRFVDAARGYSCRGRSRRPRGRLALIVFGRAFGKASFFGSLPARLRASRKIHSTWPLALRISSSAQRWTASHTAGSMRRGYCLRAMTCFLIELRCVWLENLSLGTVPKLRLGG